MALHADTVWEMRTTGSNTNGGLFYDRDPGTSVDYSQQASAQLSLSDIATDGAGTTLTSATGGFTAAMAGNGIYLTGGGSTAGWYEIVTYTDTNTVVIDRSAGASKSSVTGNVGGAVALPTQALGTACDNHVLHQKADGTYNYTETFNPQPGNAAPYQWLGYNTTRGDNPTGDNRPLNNCAAYYTGLNGVYTAKNLRFTGTATEVISRGAECGENCSFVNTSGTAGRYAVSSYTNNTYTNCTFESTNGYGLGASVTQFITSCLFVNSAYGAYFSGSENSVTDSVFDGCSTYGIWFKSSTSSKCKNSTFYDCGNGIRTASMRGLVCINNLFDTCTTGAYGVSQVASRILLDYNNYNGNGTDVNGVTKGDNATATNPSFTDAAGGDFTPASGNAVYTQGQPMTLGVGASVTTHQGAVPPVEGAGGGGCFVAAGVGRLGVQEV